MHDDADELADLIGALYDSELPAMRPLDPRNPERARGAMKLARKYEVESVRARIIRRMEADWPQDVLEWLRLIGDIKRRTELRTMLCRTGTSSDPEPDAFVPEPASAVRFAREFDVPSILPAAFYTLALADIQQDWDETRVSRPFAAAQWRLLDQEDTMRLFRGKSKLRAAASAMVKVPFPGESYCTDCKDSRLPRVFSEKWSTYLTSGGFEGGVALADAPDIIGILLSCLELLEGRGSQFAGMCETHRILYRKFVSAKLHHEWESLSEKFQLR
ncbi:hypothetical protein PsYK624_130220 [Phanerochaete sordida]|uniref:BTB domain-containing protein n=1 Tax=Phanerochaete sordida TaxID=48140 RepID=A0A9P3GKT4_9APHY|nr:hypothetical protein PsYK624_130220 [Phanerochaete sordida]